MGPWGALCGFGGRAVLLEVGCRRMFLSSPRRCGPRFRSYDVPWLGLKRPECCSSLTRGCYPRSRVARCHARAALPRDRRTTTCEGVQPTAGMGEVGSPEVVSWTQRSPARRVASFETESCPRGIAWGWEAVPCASRRGVTVRVRAAAGQGCWRCCAGGLLRRGVGRRAGRVCRWAAGGLPLPVRCGAAARGWAVSAR